jgi:short-subunit dehydrogenase
MQTVIVTGASRGIGSGIVSVLLQNNFHVIAIARNENYIQIIIM